MNELTRNVLKMMINRKVTAYNEQFDIDTLCELLNCVPNTLEDSIIEVFTYERISIEVDDISICAIDEVIAYAVSKALDMTLGFESFAESFIATELSQLMDMDMLEWL